ncbi:MAG TPA: DUF3052 family protein [Acidimicrobiia bacterium]|nr:DUF3052 family protein [Acidimicrobiia bacterium]
MTEGYSGTPLVDKLGIRPGMKVLVVDEPSGWVAANLDLPDGVTVTDLRARSADLLLVFVRGRADLERRLVQAIGRIPAEGMLWVAWPKRASGVATDVTEDVVRDVALPHGLVDVKVAALDATWSGLKLVVRRERRRDW